MGFKLLDRLKLVVLAYACEILNRLVKFIASDLR
jgi:hypothetical protein